MVPATWFDPALVLVDVAPEGLPELMRRVAEALAPAAGREAAQIETAFQEAMRGGGFSVGAGVAIPHVEIADLSETRVCLAITRAPLPLASVDGRHPDVFWFVLSKPDPRGHLLLLAHLARLSQSKTFLDGLRRASSAAEAAALVKAAELRHQPTARAVAPTTQVLVLAVLSGEEMVDDLLVELVDRDFASASILEAQTVSEAAASEVPLFAAFRDLFGDPGGRRVLVLPTDSSRADEVVGAIRQRASEHPAATAEVWLVPIQAAWKSTPPAEAGTGA